MIGLIKRKMFKVILKNVKSRFLEPKPLSIESPGVNAAESKSVVSNSNTAPADKYVFKNGKRYYRDSKGSLWLDEIDSGCE